VQAVVEAEGHIIRENQNRVISLIMKKRDKVFNFYADLKRKSFSSGGDKDEEKDPPEVTP
jgi:hypothetical protein